MCSTGPENISFCSHNISLAKLEKKVPLHYSRQYFLSVSYYELFHIPTAMTLRVTLMKHCKQLLECFLQKTLWTNMLFALAAFLNL